MYNLSNYLRISIITTLFVVSTMALVSYANAKNMPNNKVAIIQVPFSDGGPNKAAEEGPSAIMQSDLTEDLNELGFEVQSLQYKKTKNFTESAGKNRIKNIDSIVEMNQWLYSAVTQQIQKGYIPLTIGGDHSLAIGTIAAVSEIYNNDVGVLYIDRHFDAHSPKNSPSMRAHGMPVAVAFANEKFDQHPDFIKLLHIGKKQTLPKINAKNIVELAMGEKSYINPPTKWYSMEQIDAVGINAVIDESLEYLLKRVKYVYVSWDIDSINVTGTGTSGYGQQLTIREGLIIARAINKKLLKTGRLAGIEFTEIAPSLEKPELKGQTIDSTLELMRTTFGATLFNNYGVLKKNIHL